MTEDERRAWALACREWREGQRWVSPEPARLDTPKASQSVPAQERLTAVVVAARPQQLTAAELTQFADQLHTLTDAQIDQLTELMTDVELDALLRIFDARTPREPVRRSP